MSSNGESEAPAFFVDARTSSPSPSVPDSGNDEDVALLSDDDTVEQRLRALLTARSEHCACNNAAVAAGVTAAGGAVATGGITFDTIWTLYGAGEGCCEDLGEGVLFVVGVDVGGLFMKERSPGGRAESVWAAGRVGDALEGFTWWAMCPVR